jgi:hypothetical protein
VAVGSVGAPGSVAGAPLRGTPCAALRRRPRRHVGHNDPSEPRWDRRSLSPPAGERGFDAGGGDSTPIDHSGSHTRIFLWISHNLSHGTFGAVR